MEEKAAIHKTFVHRRAWISKEEPAIRLVSMIFMVHDDACEDVQRRGEAAPSSKPKCVIDYNTNMG